MEVDNKEKRKALSLYCAHRDQCSDKGCKLFQYCNVSSFATAPDVTIDAIYDKYINLPEVKINITEPCSQDAKVELKFNKEQAEWLDNEIKRQLLGECDQNAKADAGKLPMNLVPTQINRDIAQVRQYGNEKYGDPNNWRKVEKLRYVAALERHLLAYKDYLNGDDGGLDKESGIEHYKHMACNMAFICEMERWEKKE